MSLCNSGHIGGQSAMQPDYFKAAFSILPFITAIFTHYQQVKKRHEWITKKTRAVGGLGSVHWLLDTLPVWLYYIFATASIILGLSILAGPVLALPVPTWWEGVTNWADKNFSSLIFVWVVLTVLFYFNWPAMVLTWVAGVIPSVRGTIGYSNASWHVFEGETAPAVSIASEPANAFVEEIARSLINNPANPNRALRPDGLNDADAANILFFGHVIEGVLTEAKQRWADTLWTDFYIAMGALGKTVNRPFSPENLSKEHKGPFFQAVFTQLQAHLPEDFSEMPSLYTNATRIDNARDRLQLAYFGDARRMARGLFGPSYEATLHEARNIPEFGSEEIRRQFAKLTVIWQVIENIRHPSTFRIPFSRGIAALLLTRKWLRTDATRFNDNDMRFIDAYEAAQRSLLESAAETIETATEEKAIKWREEEKRIAVEKKLDWRWYLQYRVDQHIYHSARIAKDLEWKADDGGVVRIDKKAAA